MSIRRTSCKSYCHVSGVRVTNKTGFWIWWTNLLDLYTAGYNSSQITIWHSYIPTGYSTGTILISNWTHPLLRCTPSILILCCTLVLCPLIIPRHGPHGKHVSRVTKNACLLDRYLAMVVLPLFRAYALGICLHSRCLAMGICVTIF
jgi:hypothetical protein